MSHVRGCSAAEVPDVVADLYWSAPELLRDGAAPPRGTRKGDVYSLGVVLSEILSKCPPFHHLVTMSPKGLLAEVSFVVISS